MKTSNKLLVLLVAVMFSIPLIMVMGFKNAVKENRYVVKNMFGVEDIAFKGLKPFKVVKLRSSANNPLLCNIKSGNKYEYKFVNYNTKANGKAMPDNCSMNAIGDTLFISYDAMNADQHLLELDLGVADGVSVIAEGARVSINTLNRNSPKNISLDLSGGAELHVRTGHGRNDNEAYPEQEKLEVSDYSIKSSDAEVNIAASIKISNLKIDADNSRIFIGPNVMIDSLSGSISPETIVNAPYKFIKELK